MKMLTEKQQTILDFCKKFISDNGYSPSCQEIADNFGFSQRCNALQHLILIEKKGYIKRIPKISRGLIIIK